MLPPRMLAAPSEIPPEVANNAVFIYVSIGIFIFGALLVAFKKWIPMVQAMFDAMAARRQKVGKQRRDEVLADRDGQISNLVRRVDELEARDETVRNQLVEHAGWDYQVRERLAQAGIVVEPPPPLYVSTVRPKRGKQQQ